MRAVGRQGWSLMAETNWDGMETWNAHTGAFLAINDNSRFDFTYFRRISQPPILDGSITDMYQLRFGYSRRIMSGNNESQEE
jgi:hypothetical protein